MANELVSLYKLKEKECIVAEISLKEGQVLMEFFSASRMRSMWTNMASIAFTQELLKNYQQVFP